MNMTQTPSLPKRISVLPGDPDHSTILADSKVFLDEKEVEQCVIADTENGQVLVNLTKDGRPYLIPGTQNIARQWLYGEVRIELSDNAKHMFALLNEFIIVSLKHTSRRDKYITLWNPKNSGYCCCPAVAGIYYEDNIRKQMNYYHSGDYAAAVPRHIIEGLTEKSEPGYLDQPGLVVRNNAKNWKAIAAAIPFPTVSPMQPQYRGAPKLS